MSAFPERAVCPECGTPIRAGAIAQTLRSRRVRRLYVVLCTLVVLGSAAAYIWMSRVEVPSFSTWTGGSTPGGRLPVTVPELRSIAENRESGDTLVRLLLDDAASETASERAGILQVGRAGRGGGVRERYRLGWPFWWVLAYRWYEVGDLEDPRNTRLDLKPGTQEQPLQISWHAAWGTWKFKQSAVHVTVMWWRLLSLLALGLLAWEVIRYAKSLLRYREQRLAASEPEAFAPPKRTGGRRIAAMGVILLVAALVPRHDVTQSSRAVLTGGPGGAHLTVPDLREMLALTAPDAVLAARLLQMMDGTEESPAAGAQTREHIEWRWNWTEHYSYTAFMSREMAWVMPTLAIRQTMHTQQQSANPPTGIPHPGAPLQFRWNNYESLEVLLPAARGDASRRSIVVEPAGMAVRLAGIYLVWLVLVGAPRWGIAWRTRRRWKRGQCVVCAYPVPRVASMG